MLYEIALHVRNSNLYRIINVSIDKSNTNMHQIGSISELGHKFLYQRYENWLLNKNDSGIIIQDAGYENILRKLLRQMKTYNPIPSKYQKSPYYSRKITQIIEDPFFRNSKHSFGVQLADIIAYLVRVRTDASAQQKIFGLHKIYKVMKPAFVLSASRKNRYGIVEYP